MTQSSIGIAEFSLTSQVSTNVNWVKNNVIDPTDLSSTRYTNQTNCADSLGHDICVFDEFYPPEVNWYGAADCVGTQSGNDPNRTCSRSRVRINLTNGGQPTQPVVCHEMGHSVGLRHRTDVSSCLWNLGPPSSNSSVWDAHDKAHVNTKY